MKVLARIAPGILLVALVGCGGGGGGGGGGGSAGGATPLSYAGNTNAAAVTTSNASALTAHVMTGGETSQAVSSVAAAPATAQSGGVLDIGRQVHRTARNAVAQLGGSKTRTDAVSAIDVDEIEPCDSGGSMQFSGTLNDNGTGTISIQFNACQSGGTIVSGSGTMRVDVFVIGIGPTDYTLAFTRLTLNGSTTGALSGTLRVQIDPSTRKETSTENAVILLASGIMGKSENLVAVDVFDSVAVQSGYVESLSGRVFHSIHGYVDVSTLVTLRFNSSQQDFPDNGMLLLTGAGGAIRVMALSPTLLNLALDLNGDGVFDKSAMLAWNDLTGPVGANLDDDDGDGIHNSWEIAHGFNPNDRTDALADADGDGATNLSEYEGGTNPRDASSTPRPVGLSISAGNISVLANVGGTLTYTYTVSNVGGLVANNVVLTDVLPAGVNLVSVTVGQGSCAGTAPITCNMGTLGGTSFVPVTVVVSPTAQGVITNTITVSTSTFDADTSDNTVTTVTTVGLPVAGLQARIDNALPGDTILVDPGLYAGELTFRGKNVVLRSVNGPATTIIHGGRGTAVRMGPGGVITGFTITGTSGSFGSGIEVSGAGSLISGNIFEGNVQSAGGFGAAIAGNVSSPTIERNIFRNNGCDKQFLAGVVSFINSSSPRIVNNVFASNQCTGINLSAANGPHEVINNTFVGNRTGILLTRFTDSAKVYRNNILVQNDVGVDVGSGTLIPMPNVWTNNLVFGTNTTNYAFVTDPTGTNGNIAVDPKFVNQGGGNYHLQGDSPAIGAGASTGAPTTDFDGVARGPSIDIGAFERP